MGLELTSLSEDASIESCKGLHKFLLWWGADSVEHVLIWNEMAVGHGTQSSKLTQTWVDHVWSVV